MQPVVMLDGCEMDKKRARKLESLHSDMLEALREYQKDIDAPIFTVLSGPEYDRQMKCREQVIELCGKIAQQYGKPQTEEAK